MTLSLLSKVRTHRWEGAFVVCSLLALLLLLFAPSLSDASVHQWLMSSRRTRLIFHLEPVSQLLGELGARPPRWAVWFFFFCVFFSESPKPDSSASSVFLSTEFLPLYVCVLCYGEREGFGGTDQSRRYFVWESVLSFGVPHPLLPLPGARE